MPISFPRRKKKPSRNRAHRKAHGALRGDKNHWEVGLERSGDINNLQRYRLHQYFAEVKRDNLQPPFISYKLLFTEEDIREVVQEEISIKEGLALTKDTKERLGILNAKYWLLKQKWWHYYARLEDGYQRRAFDLWRSHPKWYMHRILVEDCASRQGCCARGCGCCIDRKIDPIRGLGVGHCTFKCGCCRRARGVDICDEETNVLKEQWREEINYLPRHRIMRVSIWRLVGDSYESPFDMIDIP